MRSGTTERLGHALLAAWLVWAVVTATINHSPQPLMSPYFVSPLTLAVGVTLGRRLACRGADLRVGFAPLAASAYALLTVTVLGGAGGGPLGYANANAALGVQLAALAALLALDARGLSRILLLVAAALSAVVVWPTHSDAATIALVPLLAAIVVALTIQVRRRWWSVTVGAVSVVAAAASVTVLAILPSWPGWFTAALSQTRHALWRDALKLWAEHPVVGAGPGAFQRFSPLAKNPEHATAHMSLLQIGAETGLIGVLLFTALIGFGFAMAARGCPAATLVMSAALAALLIHSFVDHILEFWPIMLVVGISLGYAASASSAPQHEAVTKVGDAGP